MSRPLHMKGEGIVFSFPLQCPQSTLAGRLSLSLPFCFYCHLAARRPCFLRENKNGCHTPKGGDTISLCVGCIKYAQTRCIRLKEDSTRHVACRGKFTTAISRLKSALRWYELTRMIKEERKSRKGCHVGVHPQESG